MEPPKRTCLCLLVPAARDATPRLVSVPAFERSAPGWREDLTAHNDALKALVADSVSRSYDNVELAKGKSADGSSAGSALIVTVADDFQSSPLNVKWAAFAAGTSAAELALRGTVVVQAAERPAAANERMIDVTKWIDRRGRMHKAAEWTDVNGKLLHELMAANGLECQTLGQRQVGNTMLFQMGHAWRVYMDLADKLNRRSLDRFADAHGGPAMEIPEQPADHRAYLARLALEQPEAYAKATAAPRAVVSIDAPEVDLQCAACPKKAADEGVRLKRCGGCSNIYYCSPECSRADWPRHKAQCKAVQKAA
jgi:hypothetical protein